MTRLRDAVSDEGIAELRLLEAAGEFPGVSLKTMLEFLLSDGIMPESGLPLTSLLHLEDWARARINASRP